MVLEIRSPRSSCVQGWFFSLRVQRESPLDYKEIQPVNPKGNQPWILTGRTDAEAEAPIFWPPDAKNFLTGEDLDAGKDGGQEEKQATEDEMVGWHHPTQWTWIWANSDTEEDRGACGAVVHGVAKSQTGLSEWTTTEGESVPCLSPSFWWLSYQISVSASAFTWPTSLSVIRSYSEVLGRMWIWGNTIQLGPESQATPPLTPSIPLQLSLSTSWVTQSSPNSPGTAPYQATSLISKGQFPPAMPTQMPEYSF